MGFSNRKRLMLGSSLFCLGFFSAGSPLADAVENEFLDMDLSQLLNVTITSVSKKEQRLSDAAAAVFVISQEDIRRSGVTHIADALAMAPGLQVAKISASKWSVSSRGFAGYTSNKLLVLVDGRSVYSPAYSGTFWDMQNMLLEDIDRIEVIRGPGGTLWGANAVNGIINIITKKSSDTLGGLVRGGAGEQETLQGGMRYGAKLNETTAGRIYLTYNDRDSNTLKAGGDAEDDWQSFQSGFRLDGQPQTATEWTLQGDVYRNRGSQTVFPYWIETSPYLTSKEGDLDTEGANILGRYRHDFAGGDSLTIQAYYDYNDRQEDLYQQTFSTMDLDIQYETDWGQRNSLTMGGGYRLIDGDFESSFQVQAEDSTDDIFNAYVQDEIKLIDDRLWFTLGVKWEHNDYTGSEWQPSGRLLWKPQSNHSLWASVARAVRTPSTVEKTGKVIAASYPTPFGNGATYLMGSDAFDSEEVIAYEAGYRWQTSAELSLDIAVFYNDYDELYGLVPVQSATGLDYTFVNPVEGESYGIEVVADWKPASWLSFAFTYSYLEQEFTRSDQDSDQIDSQLILDDSSPQHQASVRSSIELADNWQTNLWLRYVDEISSLSSADVFTEKLTVDDYFLFDMNVIWTPRENIECMIAAQNLFGDSQLQYISEIIIPVTEIDRVVYAKVTYRF